MDIAIFGTSLKPFEKRIPIHPSHLTRLPGNILERMVFEEGYGSDFGFDINLMKGKVKGVLPRNELFESCGTLLLPKFSDLDNYNFKKDQTIYGWPHCVQGIDVAQTAIDKKLTLVAFEAMFSGSGDYKHHIFHKNNEMAGFAAVQHSTQIRGITGYYGGRMKAVVFGFGSTSRGAIHALISQGVSDITVYTKRPTHLVQQQIPGVKYEQFIVDNSIAYHSSGEKLSTHLQDIDIIVNCVLQNPNKPINFIISEDKYYLKENAIVVDVSCDEKMGFDFAIPTTFDAPGFIVEGTTVYYYSVDHTPSLYWNTSSYELSAALLPYLKFIIEEKGYREESVLFNAVEIEEGRVLNKNIIEYQGRNMDTPYNIAYSS